MNAIANEAWVVGNGRVKRVESFEAYRQVSRNLQKKTVGQLESCPQGLSLLGPIFQVQLKRLNKIAPLKHGAS